MISRAHSVYSQIMALGQVDQSGKTTFIVTIIFVTLATIATGLRLLTRNAIKASIQADDWLIIAAVVMLFVTSGVEIWGKKQPTP